MTFWTRLMKALERLAVPQGGACHYAPKSRYDDGQTPKRRPYR